MGGRAAFSGGTPRAGGGDGTFFRPGDGIGAHFLIVIKVWPPDLLFTVWRGDFRLSASDRRHGRESLFGSFRLSGGPVFMTEHSMSALAKAVVSEPTDEVLIHVRFQPNADVWTIDGCPEGVSPKAWYERLLAGASVHYQALSNGRGFFRIPAATFAGIAAN
ncbi:hypothetical protein V5F53_08135 [Xanthobacter sp. V4C-4]|uniref:hypothetical protein n=1 Tax=Xanthobacter cornucopiae TaxID=3119924 RepID=UPI003728067F